MTAFLGRTEAPEVRCDLTDRHTHTRDRASGGFIVFSPGRLLSAPFILGDSYEGVRCPSGWSAEGLFGSAGRGHMARLANALSWFDVEAMAGWVAPLVRVADRPHDVFSSTCPFTPQS